MSDGANDDGSLALDTIFTEPPRPPSPEPTIVVYENMRAWLISVRLVGNHPLWGHYLWNAARALSGFIQRTPELYRGRTVLELGAGGGLPSLVAAKCGARTVVLTDYPDQALIENMAYNVAQNIEPALAHGGGRGGFDLILLSDLIFNHSQHRALLNTYTGWSCEKVVTEWFPPMFPEDPGEEEVRSTVHGWKLTRK
ncbi:hypothetical protein BGW80DRAFT_1435008 [Lactifluus volemus]|nr:hypothetical protein BGW80DRAFT_1435008 [Lactifluus volemus]